MEHTKPVRSKKPRVPSISFELYVHGRPYDVTATPFTVASGDTMYRVSYNDNPIRVFGWDEGLDRYAETDVLSEVLPSVLEMEIAAKLNEYASRMEDAA
jgi:hypothetical protein